METRTLLGQPLKFREIIALYQLQANCQNVLKFGVLRFFLRYYWKDILFGLSFIS